MPTTAAGKATSALNSIQHGILAQTAAIPGVERLEDWQAHRQGLLDALAPQDDLELCLAERAAVALLVERDGRDLLHLFTTATREAGVRLYHAQRRLDDLQAEIDRERRARLLPGEATLNRIMRYESHLSRELYRSLHELQS